MTFKSTLGDTSTPAEDERRSGAKSRGLDNFSCPPPSVSSGIRTYNLKYVDGTETERQRRTNAAEKNKRAREKEARRGCRARARARANAAGCNVTESGAVFVFRRSYFPRVSLCSPSLHLLPFSFLSISRHRGRRCRRYATRGSVPVFTRGYRE